MKGPNLTLSVNRKADADCAVEFVRRHHADAERLLLFTPDELEDALRKCHRAAEREKVVRAYVRHTYREKEERIREGALRILKEWKKKEGRYYNLVSEMFEEHPWPRRVYRGYASIFYMFPRDVEKGRFFFPYYRRGGLDPIGTIAHEMLHFMFFDYVKKHFGAREGMRYGNEDKNYVWRVSEAFNSVIEAWSPYKKVIPGGAWVYPETKKLYTAMRKRWAKNSSVPALLDHYF